MKRLELTVEKLADVYRKPMAAEVWPEPYWYRLLQSVMKIAHDGTIIHEFEVLWRYADTAPFQQQSFTTLEDAVSFFNGL